MSSEEGGEEVEEEEVENNADDADDDLDATRALAAAALFQQAPLRVPAAAGDEVDTDDVAHAEKEEEGALAAWERRRALRASEKRSDSDDVERGIGSFF